jgi:hypothetical protein
VGGGLRMSITNSISLIKSQSGVVMMTVVLAINQ